MYPRLHFVTTIVFYQKSAILPVQIQWGRAPMSKYSIDHLYEKGRIFPDGHRNSENHPWIFGARSRQRWNMFKRGAQRHLKPRIFIELAPTGEDEASAWLQRRTQIGKSAGWLCEKHKRQSAKKGDRKRSIRTGRSSRRRVRI